LIDDQLNFYTGKIILLGDDGVGKTSLRRSYMGKTFSEKYKKTLGVDISHLHFSKDDREVDIVIWDLAGERQFRNIRKAYCSGMNGAILVIDVTREISMETLLWWLEDVKLMISKDNVLPLALLGNKLDLDNQRIVTFDNLIATENLLTTALQDIKVKTFETSAKTGESVKEAFDWLITNSLDLNQK